MKGGICYEGWRWWLSGIFGGKYYWYLRTVIIIGICGRRYIASCSIPAIPDSKMPGIIPNI